MSNVYYWIQYSDHNSPSERCCHDGLIDSHPFKWILKKKQELVGVYLCDFKPITQEEWDEYIDYRIDSPDHRREGIITELQEPEEVKLSLFYGKTKLPHNLICGHQARLRSFHLNEFSTKNQRDMQRILVTPTETGDFAISLGYSLSNSDIVSGHIDMDTGRFNWNSKSGITTEVGGG